MRVRACACAYVVYVCTCACVYVCVCTLPLPSFVLATLCHGSLTTCVSQGAPSTRSYFNEIVHVYTPSRSHVSPLTLRVTPRRMPTRPCVCVCVCVCVSVTDLCGVVCCVFCVHQHMSRGDKTRPQAGPRLDTRYQTSASWPPRHIIMYEFSAVINIYTITRTSVYVCE